VNEDHGDLITQIQRALIQYYVDKEFKTVAEKQQNSVRQKKAKKVDNQPK
jgi:hypothetical protein